MGYIIALVLGIVAVPLLILLFSRRTTSGGGIDSHEHGLGPSEPSSDQPTPPPGRDRGVPPG